MNDHVYHCGVCGFSEASADGSHCDYCAANPPAPPPAPPTPAERARMYLESAKEAWLESRDPDKYAAQVLGAYGKLRRLGQQFAPDPDLPRLVKGFLCIPVLRWDWLDRARHLSAAIDYTVTESGLRKLDARIGSLWDDLDCFCLAVDEAFWFVEKAEEEDRSDESYAQIRAMIRLVDAWDQITEACCKFAHQTPELFFPIVATLRVEIENIAYIDQWTVASEAILKAYDEANGVKA